MTNVVPEIDVISEIKQIVNVNPNLRDVTCLIGCFEDTETLNTPTFCKTLTEAETIFGSDDQYDGNAALKQVFRKKISGCLIVNCTTVTGTGNDATVNRTLTQSKIETALGLVQLISFDLLYCAVELTDGMIEKIDAFCADRFEDKRPCGYIGVCTRASASAYGTTAGKLGDWCYACLTQSLSVNSDTLDLNESGAYLTNVIATLNVGKSLTAKTLDEVTAVETSYTFGDGELGKTLVGLGFFVVRLIDALNNTYEIVNSANPNGLDLYISRVRDYIVNDFALREFLGEYNDTPSYDLIKMECNNIYKKFREDLKLIKRINYTVQKGEPEPGEEDYSIAEVIIHELAFADVITKMKVYISILVE